MNDLQMSDSERTLFSIVVSGSMFSPNAVSKLIGKTTVEKQYERDSIVDSGPRRGLPHGFGYASYLPPPSSKNVSQRYSWAFDFIENCGVPLREHGAEEIPLWFDMIYTGNQCNTEIDEARIAILAKAGVHLAISVYDVPKSMSDK